jgi:AcrR family transcriptional regulator
MMLAAASDDEHWRLARRGRMLEAAASVFAAKGFDAASMDDIAFAAGMTKPTLYRYFRSKEKLFEAVFIEALDNLRARIDAEMARHSGATERLDAIIRAIVPTFREHLASLRTMSGASANAERGKRRIFRERRESIETRLTDVVRQGMEAGIFRAVDPRLTAQLIIGMAWSGSAPDRSDDVLAEAITRMVDAGLQNAPEVPA